MKAFYLNLRIFGKISLMLACMVGIFSCSETPEPDKPQMQNPPPKEDPDDDPAEVITTYEKLEGKWLIENGALVNLRKTNSVSNPLTPGPGGRRDDGRNQRVKDDNQTFIEFLADSTYVLNDPKVLGTKWNLYYGKATVHFNSKIELENYGEITNFDFDEGKFIFEIKEKDKENAIPIEAVRRDKYDDERTKLISAIWSVSGENKVGKDLLDDLKNTGVGIYNDSFTEIIDTFYPDGFTFMFTPSGSLITAHILNDKLRPFEILNWKWVSGKTNEMVVSYDYDDLGSSDTGFEVVEVTDKRLILSENSEDPDFESNVIFNRY